MVRQWEAGADRFKMMFHSRLSSSPCYSDVIGDNVVPAHAPEDLQRWRRIHRDRLIGERLDVSLAVRDLYARQITERLNQFFPNLAKLLVSGYWPCNGEPDLRPWLSSVRLRCGHVALPVIAKKHAPLQFRLWWPGAPMERGIWNIPHPEKCIEVNPDIVLVPLVGFDNAGYRLGYGGGYFDRTLAAAPKRPRIVGVGYEQSRLETIHPQSHDIPMDFIVTECRVREFNR